MSVSSTSLQTNTNFPVDPLTRQILQAIDEILRSGRIPYMLVGATARDLLLHHVYGFRITRGTYDLDFALMVESWRRFEEANALLLDVPGFKDDRREAQRLLYSPPGTTMEIKIDIIPFGKLETEDGRIQWPPEGDTVMNVAAFGDVFSHSISVQVDENLIIPVSSLPGLAILKLYAWLDRRDDRDVADLLRLFETYADAGNIDRLYEEEDEELQKAKYDTVLAGSFLLGKDANRIIAQATRDQLSASLNRKTQSALLARLIRQKGTFEDHTDPVTALFASFLRGLLRPEP